MQTRSKTRISDSGAARATVTSRVAAVDTTLPTMPPEIVQQIFNNLAKLIDLSDRDEPGITFDYHLGGFESCGSSGLRGYIKRGLAREASRQQELAADFKAMIKAYEDAYAEHESGNRSDALEELTDPTMVVIGKLEDIFGNRSCDILGPWYRRKCLEEMADRPPFALEDCDWHLSLALVSTITVREPNVGKQYPWEYLRQDFWRWLNLRTGLKTGEWGIRYLGEGTSEHGYLDPHSGQPSTMERIRHWEVEMPLTFMMECAAAEATETARVLQDWIKRLEDASRSGRTKERS